MVKGKLTAQELDALVAADPRGTDLCQFLAVELGDTMSELDNLDSSNPTFYRRKRQLEARIRALWPEMKRHDCPLDPA